MAATDDQIAQVRRMTAEPTTATYSDVVLASYIERYPLIDERGEAPYTWDTTTEPPTQEANEDWIPTYDLNLAAAEIWQEKAAALAANYDFTTQGQSFQRSQAYEATMRQARYYLSRRAARTIQQRPEPHIESDEILSNAD